MELGHVLWRNDLLVFPLLSSGCCAWISSEQIALLVAIVTANKCAASNRGPVKVLRWFMEFIGSQLPVALGQLWLRGRASFFLSEGCWFSCPGMHVKVSLGKIWNPKLLRMCCLAPCMAATAIIVWMYVWITVSHFGWKRLLNALNVNVNVALLLNVVSCR